jgi:hypothetical protein
MKLNVILIISADIWRHRPWAPICRSNSAEQSTGCLFRKSPFSAIAAFH